MRIPNKRSKNRQRNIILVIAAVLVCIAVITGIAAYSYIKEKQNRTSGKSQGTAVSDSHSDYDVLYNDKKYRYNDHLSNFVFMGIDNRSGEETQVGQADAGQADAILLASWDRVENSIALISIPRDTMTEIEVFGPTGKSLGKSTDHISLSYAFGDGRNKSCELTRNAVSKLFSDIPIQGYCSVNMDGIPVLVEEVGGVPITVPDDSLEEAYPEFQEGQQVVLNKDNAEHFVRYRDTSVTQSAIVRQKRQSVFMKAYVDKATELVNQDASFITRLYNDMDSYMVTNIGNDLFAKIAQDIASGGTIRTFEVPGEGVQGKNFDEYHVDKDELYNLVLQIFYKEVV